MIRSDLPFPERLGDCVDCDKPADILMMGYAEEEAAIELCAEHATQLARKLLEDICALSPSGRHG